MNNPDPTSEKLVKKAAAKAGKRQAGAGHRQAQAFAALLGHSSDAFLLQHDGMLYPNAAAGALLSGAPAALAPIPQADVFDMDLPEVAAFFARLAHDGHACGDFTVRRSGRAATLMNVDGTVMLGAGGERCAALQLRLPGVPNGSAQARQEGEVSLRDVIEALPDALWLKDTSGVYLMCNRAFEEATGVAAADIIGRTDYDLTDHATADAYRLHDAAALLADGPTVRETWDPMPKRQREMLSQTTKAPVRDQEGKLIGVIGIARDITRQHRDQALLESNNALLALIARGAPLSETLTRLARNVEAQHPEMLCSIMLLSEDRQHLHVGASPSLPQAWSDAIEGVEIGPLAGSCGTAAWRDEAVLVEDIASSPLWAAWKDAALGHGLAACWSTPIHSAGGELLGTFALYYDKPHRANEEEHKLIEIATSVAAIAIEGRKLEAERQRVEAKLRENQATLALALEGSGTGIWDRDMVTNVLTYSSGWKALFGFEDGDQPTRDPQSVGRLHPDDIAHVKREYGDYLAGKSDIYQAEHRVRCKDGSYKWVISRGKIVQRAPDGTPLRMIGATTDINDMMELADELRQGRDLITNLTNQVPGLVYQFRRMADGTSFFSYASEGIRSIYELAPADVAQDASVIDELVHPEDRAIYALSLTVSAEQLTHWHLEYRVVLPQAGVAWRLGDARPQRLADGSTLWHGFITDISERKRLEKTILENEHQYRLVTENSPDLIMRFDRELRCLYANPSYEKLSGSPLRELAGRRISEALGEPGEGQDTLEGMLNRVFATGQEIDAETRFTLQGKDHIFQTRVIPEYGLRGQVASALSFSHDITERKRLEGELQQLATTDFLTGLPNRRHFVARLGEELARIQRLGVPRTSVLLMDVDYFKKINDTYGHGIGDLVLQQFADLARGVLRRIDTVGRVGGEEFAIILPGAEADDAAIFAERFRKRVESLRVPHPGGEISFTVSIGISAIEPDDASADAILSRADRALYRAKEGGRNRIELFKE